MAKLFSRINEIKLFSLCFITSLTAALFYTGNNSWLFSISYIFIVFNLIVVFIQRFEKPINLSFNGLFISAILLLSWFAISIFPSEIKYLTLYNFFWVGSFIIVFLIYGFHDNKDEIWNTIWPAILLLVVLWATYGLVQYYYLHVPTNATFLNRNSLAALINLALLPAVGYFLIDKKDKDSPFQNINDKILSLTLIILFLSTFIITSRGASLSLLIGFIILISLLFKYINKSKLYTLFVIIFIAFSIATLSQYFISNLPAGFAERMVSIKDTAQAGHPRYIIWESLIPLFKEMPWYGFGLGSLWVYWPPFRPAADTSAGFFAHNDYMQILLEAGYPGLILLISLFIFVLVCFIRILKNSHDHLSLIQRVEIVSLFSALMTFAAHSFFTYNFYILPLLIIVGLYLGRFYQLTQISSIPVKTLSALKVYFKPFMFYISLFGLVFILGSYFLSVSLSSHYNIQAKKLMNENQYQKANTLFLKAQTLAPLMDNPFFSHADLLRRGANRLIRAQKFNQANSLLKLAHVNLNKAEKLNPLRPQTHHIRGLIYEREQPEQAKIEYIKALKLDPRFLFSRIRLAKLLHNENQLKQALEVLYKGVDYNYPVSKVMLEYMKLFAKYSREAGVESFALHLEANIKKFMTENPKNH